MNASFKPSFHGYVRHTSRNALTSVFTCRNTRRFPIRVEAIGTQTYF